MKRTNHTNWERRCGDTEILTHHWQGCKMMQPLQEHSWKLLLKIKHILTIYYVYSATGPLHKKIKVYDMSLQKLLYGTFWNRDLQWSATGNYRLSINRQLMSNLWHSHTKKYKFMIKVNEVLIYAT